MEEKKRLLFTIAFDGTPYHGWQVQKNAPTVQGVFGDALMRLFGEKTDVTGCSRTDAGVHANMFCCHTEDMNPDISEDSMVSAMNSLLPDTVTVKSVRRVGADFHARYDCKYKEYVYKIYNAKIPDPFLRDRALFFPEPIDIGKLGFVSQELCGKHDFSSFMASGSKITDDTVRTVEYFRPERHGDMIEIYVCADGFLYNMVRIMVGTFIDASLGKLSAGDITGILEKHDRRASSFTAKAHGLYLNKVIY